MEIWMARQMKIENTDGDMNGNTEGNMEENTDGNRGEEDNDGNMDGEMEWRILMEIWIWQHRWQYGREY